ncbi:hypothetical protein niasHS_007944 [Heterodera schachtii]|uniref:Uncharacterized protein n=1 Tax=Heterodera schachtii TaxID=97005 RepID=A0ABD2JQ32_HETSC
MQNGFVANLHQNGIAFLADYAALWLLGLDMLPMYNKQQQQIKLFISRSCSCTMEAWFVQPSDSVRPSLPKMLSAGSASCPPKLTDKIFPINLTNNGEQQQMIKIKGLTDAKIKSILVELLSAKKGSESKTEVRFKIGTDSDLEVTLPRLSKSIRSKGVRLANGIYVLHLDIVLTKRCYVLRINGTQMGRPICSLEGNLPLEEISEIKMQGQMLLLGDPLVKQNDDEIKFIQQEPSQKRFDWWALPKGSEPLDCARLFANDEEYIGQMIKRRISREEDPAENELDMSCKAIRSRNRFWHSAKDEEQGGKDEKEHANYPMAQIRTVYKDYVVVELEFAATFSPLNWYCFVVDAASPALFKRRVRALAKCFPNVIMGDERPMKSDGEGMMEAVLDCFERLDTPQRKWEYVTLLQNHDTAIKTHVQMAQIFTWMDGANDVQVVVPPPGRVDKITGMDWSFEALNLFKNVTLNTAVPAAASVHGFSPHLLLSKGYFEISLTRAMVRFIRLELNLTELVRRMNLIGYGRDEIMLVTLHSADQLNAPGGFTQTCFNQKKAGPTKHLTRETLWAPDTSCPSAHFRHGICIFGVEDLARLAAFPHFFFNRFWPAFDFGALLCVYERLFNMTHLHTGAKQLDKMAPVVKKSFVQQLPNVRFQSFKRKILNKRSEKQKMVGDKMLTFNETMSFKCDGE